MRCKYVHYDRLSPKSFSLGHPNFFGINFERQTGSLAQNMNVYQCIRFWVLNGHLTPLPNSRLAFESWDPKFFGLSYLTCESHVYYYLSFFFFYWKNPAIACPGHSIQHVQISNFHGLSIILTSKESRLPTIFSIFNFPLPGPTT